MKTMLSQIKLLQPKPRDALAKVNLYLTGRRQTEGKNNQNSALLNANENPYGCSENVKRKITEIDFKILSKYPDGDATQLKNAIAKQHQIKPDNIICGNGSDEIINLVALAYLESGDEAIYSQYGFLMYRSAILASGAKPVIVKEKNLQTDCDAIIKAVNKNTKVIFIANPNNPTGTYINEQQIRNLIEKIPQNIILLLDNAYTEYATAKDYTDALKFVQQYPNIITTRTFSKIYGLAALRVGWACANKNIIDNINKIRAPFNVSSIAQICAIEALDDQNFILSSKKSNKQWRENIFPKLQNIGINIPNSQGNFILLKFKDQMQAEKAQQFLEKNQIFLRNLNPYKMHDALRYSCGLNEQNNKVLQCLEQFIQQYKR